MRRVFADASVLIAGADSRSGASRAVLMLAEVGLFKLVVCRQVLDEVERNIRKKLPRIVANKWSITENQIPHTIRTVWQEGLVKCKWLVKG